MGEPMSVWLAAAEVLAITVWVVFVLFLVLRGVARISGDQPAGAGMVTVGRQYRPWQWWHAVVSWTAVVAGAGLIWAGFALQLYEVKLFEAVGPLLTAAGALAGTPGVLAIHYRRCGLLAGAWAVGVVGLCGGFVWVWNG